MSDRDRHPEGGPQDTPHARDGTRNPSQVRRLTPAEEAAAMLAHEIRGPLTVVLGYLGLLARVSDERSREHALSAATRAAEQIDAIIDDVAASLEPGDAKPIACTPVPVRDVVDRIVGDVPTSDVAIIVRAQDGCVAWANELRLARAFGNVLGNALKFSPARGTVTVSIAEQGGRVLLAVEDQGPGIPPGECERVFGAFERLSRDADKPGSGLGLALARDAVSAFGGTVRVLPRPEAAGACVVIDVSAADGD